MEKIQTRWSLVIGVLCFVSSSVFANTAIVPIPREEEWWQQRHKAVNERVSAGNVDLLFIGDSITHGWEKEGLDEWNRRYPPRNAVNMGFSGDRTQHVLWRLEHGNLENISPKLAIIMIGTNNWADNTAEEIAAGVQAIVSKIRSKCPETKILVLAIFPRADCDKQYQDKLVEASRLFSVVAQDPLVEYLDISTVFLNEKGEIPASIMPDKLHPNALGYALWAHALEPTLARLMGEDQWCELFNGKDLTGWQQVGGDQKTWGVEDGRLFTDGEGGGWLSTLREFRNFELQLEFNVPAGGNSGVFIRAPRQGNPAFEGLEIQVLDDYAPQYAELKPWQFCGSVYALIAPAQRATKPAGEWQKMYIRYEGFGIQVRLNDVEIINGNISDFKDKAADHPGVLRKSGFIGLQNHGSRLDFRNILLRELP